jgi:hypothetical protein
VQEPAGELEGEAVVVLVVPAVGQGAGYPRLGDDDVAVGEHGGDIEGAVGDEHGTEFLGQEPHDPVPADHVRGAVADGQGGGVAWRGEPLGFGREDGAVWSGSRVAKAGVMDDILGPAWRDVWRETDMDV